MDSIDEYIKNNFSEKRKIHTHGVIETSGKMARLYGADLQNAETAAKFHDMFRGKDVKELDSYITELGLPSKYLGNANLSHGKIAAEVMKRDWGIKDEDVINAVKNHTTGRQGMSLLEKIIFVADAIEPSRDYPGVDKLRELAFKDLDSACLMSLDATIDHLNRSGIDLDDDTMQAADWLRREGVKSYMNSREIALESAKLLSAKKASDIIIIDIEAKSSFADYFILASGMHERQIGALADEVEDGLAARGFEPKSIEGKKESGWILMDYGDVIVNILTRDMRERYNIERVWGDCDTLNLEETDE